MLEDKLLFWKIKHGSKDALRAIYQKYADDLLNLAVNLLNDKAAAEDVVQDVFVSFVQSAENTDLKSNLKGFLLTSAANRSRDYIRRNIREQNATARKLEQINAVSKNPIQTVTCKEELEKLSCAMAGLPFEQREVIVLHLHGELKFRQIAKIRNVSIKTVQSRYRYGLDKLRSIMNGEVTK